MFFGGHVKQFNGSRHEKKWEKGREKKRSLYLVELQNVEELEEPPVLAAVLELDVVLLQTVKGQLGLVVNVHLHRVLEKSLFNEMIWNYFTEINSLLTVNNQTKATKINPNVPI